MPGLYAVTQPTLMAPKVPNLNPVKAKFSMKNGQYLKLITHKIWIGFAGTRKHLLVQPLLSQTYFLSGHLQYFFSNYGILRGILVAMAPKCWNVENLFKHPLLPKLPGQFLPNFTEMFRWWSSFSFPCINLVHVPN